MRSEAQKPEYKIEAYLLRDLRQVPTGWNLSDLWPEQSTFVIYLVAMLPTLSDLGLYLRFLTEKEELEDKAAWEFVEERNEMQQAIDRDMAANEAITIEEYYNREGEKIRQARIDALQNQYYPSSKSSSNVRAMQTRLQKIQDKFGDGPVYPELPPLSDEERIEIEKIAKQTNA